MNCTKKAAQAEGTQPPRSLQTSLNQHSQTGLGFPDWDKAENIYNKTHYDNFAPEYINITKTGYLSIHTYADSTAVVVSLVRNGVNYIVGGLKNNVRSSGFTDIDASLVPVRKGDVLSISGGGGFAIEAKPSYCGNGANIYFVPFRR